MATPDFRLAGSYGHGQEFPTEPLSLVWSRMWIPGIFLVPCYAIWCGFLSTLVHKEQPRYGTAIIKEIERGDASAVPK